MSILIPGKIPKQKSIFIEITPYGSVNEIINPLLSVPIGLATEIPPHGDLVDRDMLLKSDDIETLYDALRYVPPIIPADRGGADNG